MRRSTRLVAVAGLLCLASMVFAGVYAASSERITFMEDRWTWSIGVYAGLDPFTLSSPNGIKNPILTSADITDRDVAFVADPFMVKDNGTWYMFFEIMNKNPEQADIGLATSTDALHWEYQQIVLDEPFHLSYPCVFNREGQYYMMPECDETRSVRLYKAEEFPTKWVFVKTLLSDAEYVDPTIFCHDNRWWVFTCNEGDDILRLHYADDLLGPWTEHPKSPIISGDKNIARPGGRVMSYDGKLMRFTQDDDPMYGNQLRVFIIDTLTISDYAEHEAEGNPVLEAARSRGWNEDGMHQCDPYQLNNGSWVACVDGLDVSMVFKLGNWTLG